LDEVSNIDWAESEKLASLDCWQSGRLAGRVITNPRHGDAKPLCDFSWSQQWDEIVMVRPY
jgi:hypothetical protein